jgi:hypothetical protein
MTVNGILANTSHPLKGLDKRTAWISHETVVYGNLNPERRAELTAITEACTGENILSKIFSVSHVTNVTAATPLKCFTIIVAPGGKAGLQLMI